MTKRLIWVTIFSLCLLSFPSKTFAQSQYVLPYPSSMPGTVWYRLHIILEKAQKYWYFGSFAQFKYNLSKSDKYLVEAKTLFEYKQYLLGIQALRKSNSYFDEIQPDLQRAKQEKKDTSVYKNVLHQAAQKHIEVLEDLLQKLPPNFLWQPEKSSPITINFHFLLNQAIKVRKKVL